jgi:molybdopterin-guanine dinucleotide biosynthesis protein A
MLIPAPEKIDTAAITGLILAGGTGRRMGGVDKGLLAFNGAPMAMRVLERLRPQVGSVLINANRELEEWKRFGLPVVADEIGGFSGPLAGVHAGLLACGTPWLLTAPCDSPFLPLDLATRLTAAIVASGCDLAVARSAGRLQPVFALLRRELLASLDKYLRADGHKMARWFEQIDFVPVDFDDAAAFANINTPADLDELRR